MDTAKPALEPPINMPTYARLRESIRTDIVSGRWKLGQHLVLGELASRYETSRSPVREALFSMYGQGMIELPANKGAMVLPVDKTYLGHCFPVRRVLRLMLVKQACAIGSVIEMTELQRLLRALHSAAQAHDADVFHHRDRELHDHLDRMGGNPHALEVLAPRHDMLAALRTSRLPLLPESLQEWVSHTRRLVTAVEQRDAAEASTALVDHCTLFERHWHRLLDEPLRAGADPAAETRHRPHRWRPADRPV